MKDIAFTDQSITDEHLTTDPVHHGRTRGDERNRDCRNYVEQISTDVFEWI